MLKINEDSQRQQIILKLLLDNRIRILNDLMQNTPKSAIELSRESKIDLNAVYRVLHKLDNSNFLIITFNITPDGKKSYLYKSKLESINARYHKGILDISLNLNS
ncbi:MAG TPA: ArsR family transcriptional regulator [Nitrosopumilus sp.]|nr:ArsR family transcriptional regulator [Nitrosopumilus sp.]